ncbi:MAG: hypothetical protein H5T66_09395 [Chloroflexi bacterium]|nr:hypothetical protein [Chloroflexota bacterium]
MFFKRGVRRALVVVAGLFILFLGGCAQKPLLKDISIRPEVISPNADGVDDIAEMRYTLLQQGTISIYLLDEAGKRYDFRKDLRRSPGKRTAYFGGVVDGRLLPDGTYQVVFEARDDRGRSQQVIKTITLVDGDKVPLEIRHLSIWPQSFTPNRDGITDRVTIGYDLSKEATRVEVYLLDAAGNKYPVPEDKIREMGAPGTHEHDYDAGVDLGATPPPNGLYTVVVEAEDAVGNLARAQGTLEIKGGGVPQVEIVNRAAVFSPTVVPLHSTLTFTCTVRNIGTVPVRTKGPESGTTYSTSENYNTLGAYEEPGIFRVGLDFEGNSAGRLYPFRWQLGQDEELTTIETEIGPQKYLMPGQSVTVVGHLRIDDPPPKVEPYYWIGLIHEQVWIVQDRVEPTAITIGF